MWTQVRWTLIACCFLVGCAQRPPRVPAPKWNPKSLGNQIFAEFDADQNGQLNSDELERLPSVRSSLSRIDNNGDQQLSRDELMARFQLYKDMRLGSKRQPIQLIYKGKPLVDATVELIPEDFLSEIVQPAKGTTDFDGIVYPQTATDNLDGMQLGFYRVKVSSPSVDLPARFNSNGGLGLEVSPISEGEDAYGPVVLELK